MINRKSSLALMLWAALAAGATAQTQARSPSAAPRRSTAAAAHTRRDVVVQGGKIASVEERRAPAPPPTTCAASRSCPGLIDTHVHIDSHFGKDGRATTSGETPPQSMLYAAENAYVTLMAGFTTVQSIGSPLDVDLRDAIARGVVPGPRMLTSIRQLNENTGTPDEIRAFVRKRQGRRRRSRQAVRVEEHPRRRRARR